MNESDIENPSYKIVLSDDVPDIILYINTKTFDIYIYKLQNSPTEEVRKWIDKFKEDYLITSTKEK
jgi:hypothetical protein